MSFAGRAVHLVGGGWSQAAAGPVYGPFVGRCHGPITLMIAREPGCPDDSGRYVDVLRGVGAREVRVLAISPGRPPTRSDLDGSVGVVVGGGLTPLYHSVLVTEAGAWLPEDVHYLGFSAGAAIAPVLALIGGFLAESDGNRRAVCPEDTAEDLDLVTTVPGLGLVPWTVDVHAAQWGTLGRLVHAVAAGRVERGFAIDEDTSLIVTGESFDVTGAGLVHEVRPDACGGVRVVAHAAPSR